MLKIESYIKTRHAMFSLTLWAGRITPGHCWNKQRLLFRFMWRFMNIYSCWALLSAQNIISLASNIEYKQNLKWDRELKHHFFIMWDKFLFNVHPPLFSFYSYCGTFGNGRAIERVSSFVCVLGWRRLLD